MKVTIVHPIDNIGKKYGGVESHIKDFVLNFGGEIEIIGFAIKGTLEIGKWHKINFHGKLINFFPVIELEDKDLEKRPKIPPTLKFVIGLFRWKSKISFKDRIVIYHRLEPFIPFFCGNTNKNVLFVHGDVRNLGNPHTDTRWKHFRILYYFLERFLIKKFSKVFVASRSGIEYYKLKYPKYSKKFIWFSPGYDASLFNTNNKQELKNNRLSILKQFGLEISSDDKILLYVGRLEMPKNPILLIESFNIACKINSSLKLIIIGDGSLKEKIINKVKELNLNSKVFILGARDRKDISTFMKISDLFVLTSMFEGMPVTVLEALGCGLPVISTDVGDVALVVKNGISGKIVPNKNPYYIAESILEIIENLPTSASCEAIALNYTTKNLTKKLMNVFAQEFNQK